MRLQHAAPRRHALAHRVGAEVPAARVRRVSAPVDHAEGAAAAHQSGGAVRRGGRPGAAREGRCDGGDGGAEDEGGAGPHQLQVGVAVKDSYFFPIFFQFFFSNSIWLLFLTDFMDY